MPSLSASSAATAAGSRPHDPFRVPLDLGHRYAPPLKENEKGGSYEPPFLLFEPACTSRSCLLVGCQHLVAQAPGQLGEMIEART